MHTVHSILFSHNWSSAYLILQVSTVTREQKCIYVSNTNLRETECEVAYCISLGILSDLSDTTIQYLPELGASYLMQNLQLSLDNNESVCVCEHMVWASTMIGGSGLALCSTFPQFPQLTLELQSSLPSLSDTGMPCINSFCLIKGILMQFAAATAANGTYLCN